MKARLLSTVAASLLIGIGAASAQSMNQPQAPERAPAAQQNAPAEKIAPSLKAGERKAPETTGQASPDATSPKASDKAGDSERPADNLKGSSDSKSPSAKSATDNNKADNSKGAASETNKTSTTGQGAASGQAKLSTEQRNKISTSIRSQKVERVEPSQLNVSINVGTRIPNHVRFHRLPADVVTIYPEWRGYDYILVGDQIVIIEPRTHEIVFIIES